MILRVAGIDPGREGAIAVVQDGLCVAIHDIPHVPTGRTGGKMRLDMDEWRALLETLSPGLVAAEEPTPRPGEAAACAWASGYGYGVISTTCHMLGIPLRCVRPADWTRALRLPGKKVSPGAARALALELYPAAGLMLQGPQGGRKPGRAEALLIAHWAALRRG